MKGSSIKVIFLFVAFSLIQGNPLVFSQAQDSQAPKSSSSSGQEDFTSASLAGSSLRADPPELIDRTDEASYVHEWVTLQWRPDDPVYLYVVRPKGIEKPPVVIYLYDYPAETDTFRDDAWCERAVAGGYAAAGFVPALNGHRYHSLPMKEWFVSRLQESLAKSSHDVQMVLNYLGSRGDLDMNRVGMYGVGAGGTIAALAASVDSRIKAVDLIDPWGDWPAWLRISEVVPDQERPLYLKNEFLSGIAGYDPVTVLPKLGSKHVRLVQFGQGSETPAVAQKRIADALPASAQRERVATLAEFEGGSESGTRWIKHQLAPPRTAIESAAQGNARKEENR